MSTLSAKALICLERVFSCKRHAPSNGPDDGARQSHRVVNETNRPFSGSLHRKPTYASVQQASDVCLSCTRLIREQCHLTLVHYHCPRRLEDRILPTPLFCAFSSLRNNLALLRLRFPLMCNEVNGKKTSSDDTKFHKVVSKGTKTLKSI